MEIHQIPPAEFSSRVGQIKDFLKEEKLGAVVAHSQPRAHMWGQTGHVSYISNWADTDRLIETAIVVAREGDPVLLLCGLPYMFDQVRQVSWMTDFRLVAAAHPRSVSVGRPPSEEGAEARQREMLDFGGEVARILTERGSGETSVGLAGLESVPVAFYESLKQALGPGRVKPVPDIISTLRSIKSRHELEVMREAARLSDLGYETLLKTAKPGMWGYEVVAEMERAVRAQGADFVKYWMASGPSEGWNNNLPDLKPHVRKLQAGDQIISASYVVYQGYWAHGMRAGALGRPSPQQKRIYPAALGTQQALFDIMKPGVPISKLIETAEQTAQKYGYPVQGGRIGHGIGLDYAEEPYLTPKSDKVLKAGMTAVIHPLLEVPEIGNFFVPVGDMCHVTENGVELLFKFPRENFLVE